MALVTSYVLPAVILWAVLGLFLNTLPLAEAALVVMVPYGALYGTLEIVGRSRLRLPGSAWQVPSEWVRSVPRWRRVLVWGSILGPGFATRNPYAGFGVLPIAVAAVGQLRNGVILAAIIGAAHAMGRAGALLRDVRRAAAADYLESVLKSMYWRTFDGYALLMVSGAALTTIAFRS
jgi:hypothetical protein